MTLPVPVLPQLTSNLFGIAPSGLSIQERFIDHMSRIYDAGIVIDIETPFAVLTNMGLLSFSSTRSLEDEAVRYVIRAQQIEFAKVKITAVAALKRNPSSSSYGDREENGDQQGTGQDSAKATSLLGKLFK